MCLTKDRWGLMWSVCGWEIECIVKVVDEDEWTYVRLMKWFDGLNETVRWEWWSNGLFENELCDSGWSSDRVLN